MRIFEKARNWKNVLLQERKKNRLLLQPTFLAGAEGLLSPRSTLVGQDGSTVPKGTVFTAVLFSSFCKKRIKKSAAFATDLFGRGRRTLSPRSTLSSSQDGSTVPKGTVFSCRPILVLLQEANKKNRLLSQPTFLAGAEGLFLLARRSSVRTALPCQRARYSLPSYSRPSARSKEKNRLLSQPTFLAGAEGLEPSTKVLETHVLPLHHTPKHLLSIP